MTGRIFLTGDNGERLNSLQSAIKKHPNLISSYFTVKELPGKLATGSCDLIAFYSVSGSIAQAVGLYDSMKQSATAADAPIVLMVDGASFEKAASEAPIIFQDILCVDSSDEELVAKLIFLYRKFHRMSDGNVIHCGELEIDVSRYEVLVSGKKVDLTYTEYELLRFLAGHPGQVFSRDVLLNKVWGYDYFGGARTVDVHIRRLRAKIEQGSLRFIETLRNVGYRFTAVED